MTRWFRRVVPCLRNTQLNTNSFESDENSHNTIKINNKTENNNNQVTEMKEKDDILEKISEVEIFTQHYDDEGTEQFEVEINNYNFDNEHEEIKNNRISCTIHKNLNDISKEKVPQTNTRCSCNDKPCYTLVFKTIIVDGETSTTRLNTIEPCLNKKDSKKSDLELSEDIKDSKIKLVFSHEVLETFIHNSDKNKENQLGNDFVICTLFPEHQHVAIENEMETDNLELNRNVDESVYSETSDKMDVDDVTTNYTDHTSLSMSTSEYNFNKSPSSAQRSECILTSTNSVKGFYTSISKSSPHMQQQENNNCLSREVPRLRRNVSKRVSWKENVEVCFFNHSSRLTNEILQEVQPLIDHEVYWKSACEMDQKRREEWLKIRAEEQCLIGDGQFFDYFTHRSPHIEDDE